MNDLLNSKFVTDLKEGKLPEMEITMATATMVKLSLALLFAALLVVFIAKRI